MPIKEGSRLGPTYFSLIRQIPAIALPAKILGENGAGTIFFAISASIVKLTNMRLSIIPVIDGILIMACLFDAYITPGRGSVGEVFIKIARNCSSFNTI